MNRRRIALIALTLAAAWLVWWFTRTATTSPSGTAPGMAARAGSAPDKTATPPSTAAAAAPAERSHLADELNAPGGTIEGDLRIVTEVLDAFRTNFPRHGNPVGSNAEITAALCGRNPLKLALIPPDHPAINAGGELCDRWGTPFFFHAESGTKMAVRSAGPDRKMWTGDDVVREP